VVLGRSGIEVSRLCFGTLTLGPLQGNYSLEEGSGIMAYAMERGVVFFDTAQLYKTYEYIRLASQKTGMEPVVSTKSYAYDKEGAIEALEEARKGLDRDVVDIFMLHEQESRLTLKGHRDALEYYLNEKEKGRIRAVGVSTHNVEVVEAAANMPEIDVVHPIYNITGIGINDGTSDDMEKAIRKASDSGKGIFSMKPLGGGSLISGYSGSMAFVLGNDNIQSVAVGMRSRAEIDMNLAVFEGRDIPVGAAEKAALQNRRLHIEFWCEKCGRCIERCRQDALSMVEGGVEVDENKCVVCGYCCSECPAFAMKIF
jgi:aryl-alcohol dehydrogenase-like predicted oxidoreductase